MVSNTKRQRIEARKLSIRAKSRYIRVSPYKLRPLADVIRGEAVSKAISWLKTCGLQRARSITKTLESAYANAKNKYPEINSMDAVYIQEVRIDQGPIIRYFKPGAMGRANPQRKRLSHIEIILCKKDSKNIAAN